MRDPKDLTYKSSVPGAQELNWSQKYAKAVRPQKPADATERFQKWQPGQVPQGGFRSVFCFEDSYNSKQSPTSGGGKKVY
ncbi:MAG: hypothetical protein ACR2JS_03635 [Candidatus Nanopelagicales bacterium]